MLDDVGFSVGRGEIVGVIGPNGAGKTTLFDVITGFTSADAGSVHLGGRRIDGLSPHQIFEVGCGRTLQTARPFHGMTLAENVLVPALQRDGEAAAANRRAQRALQALDLGARADRPAHELTVSEIRRMELARAYAGGPDVLVLDEFLGGLGGGDADLILAVLRRWRAEEGLTVLAIEHTMRAMVGLVDRFVVLNFGKVIAVGTAAEIGDDPTVVEAYLGKRWAALAGR